MKRLANKTWVIADTHFGHSNVIKYCNRPFQNKYEMDETIILNWNKRIKEGHDVFFLGDFSFYGKDRTTEICNMLNGNKKLIKGNHDTHSNKYYIDCGFDQVYDFPIIVENFWILSHEPIELKSDYPFFNIHGHIHNNIIYEEDSLTHYCVSVEQTNYKPLDFDKIRNEVFCRIERN